MSRDREGADSHRGTHAVPLAYLITFTCYGTWLYGKEGGPVDRAHNIRGTPVLPADPGRLDAEREAMRHPPYQLDERRRAMVLDAIREVCGHRDWTALAAHVRTNHVHVVVSAGETPERVMGDFKAYASRRLDEARLDGLGQKRWTRHGSTRYLWKSVEVETAIRYVIEEQGEPMAVFDRAGETAPSRSRLGTRLPGR